MKKQYLPIVKRRSSNDPISITNYFGKTKAKIEIRGFQEDLEALWEYWESIRDSDDQALARLGAAFLTSFMSPASEVIGPNWRKDNKAMFMEYVRLLAAFYYAFFKYCLEVMPDNLPISVSMIAKDPRFQNFANSMKATAYTAFCLEASIGKLLSAHGLKAFYDLEENTDSSQDLQSFYITYVQEGRNILKKLSPYEVIQFWCNVLVILYETTYAIVEKDNIKEKCSIRHQYFLFDMLCAFLLHENDYIVPAIKEREEVSQIHGVLLQLYPYLKDTGSILEEIRNYDFQSWCFFEDYMTYHNRPELHDLPHRFHD